MGYAGRVKRTVMEILDETASRHGSRPAMKFKRDGTWQTLSWKEVRDTARLVGRALIRLGAQPSKGVAIIGFNSPEWVMADLGAILAGAMPAGIYTTSSAEQCQYIAHHSESAVAFAENAEQVSKLLKVRGQLPHLKTIVQWSGEPEKREGVIGYAELLKIGESVPEADLEARIAAQTPDDPCTLIYTSGTTGDPKAVMVSHTNLSFVSDATRKVNDLRTDGHVISYLPLSHVAEQVVSVHVPLAVGACVWFAESLEKLGDNLREVRPTVFFAVPRVWEKMQAKIAAAGAAAPPLRRRISAWARKTGLGGGYADQTGARRPLLYPLADKVVFQKVRERLGLDRCRVCITSAAPISRDTLEFFLSLGIPLYEVYGMSECTGPATFSTPSRYRTGTVGWAVPGTELKVEDDGEICMRGDHVFKGYYKDPVATGEALDSEGWLHSGDIGEIDAAGFLQITDRKKELLITAGGENVAPQVIESHLKSIPVIAQAVVLGDRRKFLTALLTLDPERVEAEAVAAGSPARDAPRAAACRIFRAHLEKQIEGVNAKLARVQTIKRFEVLPAELTIDGGELTPTMKLRRKIINSKYKDVIESLYAD